MIASRGFTARRSLACALPSLNLKKRRDYSQSAYSVCIFYFLFSRMGSALLSRFDLVSWKHQDYILSFVRSWAIPSCSALNATVCCASSFLLLSLWIKSLSVITYKNCEMLLSAAFYYAAQSRNDTFIYNQLSPCGRDFTDTSGGSRGGARGARPPALFLDQTKKFFWRPAPLYLRVWMTAPPLISRSGSGTGYRHPNTKDSG